MNEKEEQLEEEKDSNCPKCNEKGVTYPLVKCDDKKYRCGNCGFTSDDLLSKDQRFLK